MTECGVGGCLAEAEYIDETRNLFCYECMEEDIEERGQDYDNYYALDAGKNYEGPSEVAKTAIKVARQIVACEKVVQNSVDAEGRKSLSQIWEECDHRSILVENTVGEVRTLIATFGEDGYVLRNADSRDVAFCNVFKKVWKVHKKKKTVMRYRYIVRSIDGRPFNPTAWYLDDNDVLEDWNGNIEIIERKEPGREFEVQE